MSLGIGVSVQRLRNKLRDAYAVLGINPKFVADFVKNKYKGHSTFSSAITHARAGNATMTDGYGPELVTNGTFDTDVSGFTANGTATLSAVSGRMRITSGGGNARAIQGVPTVVGKSYVVSLDYNGGQGTAHYMKIADASDGTGDVAGTIVDLDSLDVRQASFTFTAESTTSYLTIAHTSGSVSGNYFDVDNVSVREMPVIKWAPHNLQLNSESSTGWGANNVLFTDNALSDPFGGNKAIKVEIDVASTPTNRCLRTTSVGIAGVQHTQFIYIKAGSGVTHVSLNCATGDARFQLSDGAKTFESTGVSATSTSLANGWFLFTLTFTPSTTYTPFLVYLSDRDASTATGFSGGEFIYMVGVSLYRSDLGGMVDNPERGDSYVPTTSSDKYLPRVGHHVFNGDAWVNEGVLAESEARTNELLYSNDPTNAAWTVQTGTAAQDEVGPDGVENSAWTLADNDASGFSLRQQVVTVPNDSNTICTSLYVKKDNDESRFPEFQMELLGGTGRDHFIALNTKTGATDVRRNSSGGIHTVEDAGEYWRFSFTVNNNSTGNTSLRLKILPAVFTSLGGAVNSTLTGSIVYYGGQIELNASTPSSYIPTSGSSVTRAAETFTIPSANLPWPTPQIIGSELVTSGTFDDSNALDDWTTSGSVSVVSGEAVIADVGGTDAYISQQLSGVVTGEIVILTFDQSAGTNLIVQVGFSAGSNLDNQFSGYGVGSHEIIIVAKRDNPWLSFRSFFTDTSNTIDNVSVREINPLSVSIGMEGRITYADEDVTNTATLWNWSADSDNRLFLRMRTDGTKTGQLQAFHEEGGTAKTASTGVTYFSPDVLVPYNSAMRSGSTFVNLAEGGVSLTTVAPTGLPDLSAEGLEMGHDYMGTIGTFRVWDKDLGDDGIVEATNPSLEPSLSLTFEGTGTNSFVVNNWSE